MAFPDDDLQQRTEIALGADINGDPSLWSWTDISAYVRTADGGRIRIKRGRRNDSGKVPAATCEMEFDNSDGRFCTLYPLSPYFPLLEANTPIRVSVSPDSGATWWTRYSGYLSRLPTRWRGPGGSDSWVPVMASSIKQRLGEEPAQSPLMWTAPNLPTSGTCLEYWPIEDDEFASSASSYFPDGLPMTAGGTIEFGASSPPAGSRATAQSDYEFMKANPPSLTGIVRPYAGTGEWTVLGIFKTDQGSVVDQVLVDCDVNHGEGSTDPDQVRVILNTDHFTLEVYREDGTLLGSTDGSIQLNAPNDGSWHAFAFTGQQQGADVQFTLWYEGNGLSTTVTNKTLGTLRKVAFPSTFIDTAAELLAVGHLAVYNDALTEPSIDRYRYALHAHVTPAGERVDERMERVVDEAAMVYSVTEDAAETGMYERLGDQAHANTLTILEDAAEADGGLLFEPMDFADGSLRYRARSALNAAAIAAPALTLTQDDFAELEQDDDGYLTTTRVRISGAGSSAVAAADTVQTETSGSMNVRWPDRLPDAAGWALYQGTRKAYRYPRIRIPLHGSPGLISDWAAADLGDRILIPDPPPGVVDDIDLILDGYAETIGPNSWDVEPYCSPAARYRIARLDDTTYGRMDTESARLVNAASSPATVLDVETVDGAEWSTATSGFDIGIGGERMTATAIAGSFTDTYGRSVSNGWGTSDSGHSWTVLGGAASDYSVTGTRGLISVPAVNSFRSTYIGGLDVAAIDRTITTRIPVLATGAPIQVRQTARWDTAANTYYAATLQVETTQAVTLILHKVVAGTTTVLRSKTVPLTHTAATDFKLRFRVQGSWLYAKVWNSASAEPTQWSDAAWDTAITARGDWGTRCILITGNTNTLPVAVQFDNESTVMPQKMTVTREVNGVVKTHPALAGVGLFNPSYLGL